MAPTSDERREVARKIREYVDAYGDGIEDAEMVLLGTVWGRDNRGDVVRPTSEAELLSMLADLIDLPTCKMKSMPKSRYRVCCRCGAFVRKDAVTNAPRQSPSGSARTAVRGW